MLTSQELPDSGLLDLVLGHTLSEQGLLLLELNQLLFDDNALAGRQRLNKLPGEKVRFESLKSVSWRTVRIVAGVRVARRGHEQLRSRLRSSIRLILLLVGK